MGSVETLEPSVFVIFGGTGDLSRRKLLPALARHFEHGTLAGKCAVVGVSPDTSVNDESYRDLALKALSDAGLDKSAIDQLNENLYFQTIGKGTKDDYAALASRLNDIRKKHDLPQNYAFYLALPPGAVAGVVEGLDGAGLSKPEGWSRLVVEKPFGRDLASAKALNDKLHQHFREEQIYRIDHYLGKETVQNLLVFRFANAIFESLWNRERVHSVEIRVAEDLGVGTRAGYYDKSGATRDMIQNHLTQLLTLVAMEVPTSFEADAIRHEKIKVLKSIAPIDCDRVVRGQYAGGTVDNRKVPGYREEAGVADDSQTDTFVGLEILVNTWRWKGVPFYLRTGKRMKKRLTQIIVRFNDVPVSLFRSKGLALDTADILVLTLQPDEGFSLHFDVKEPGEPFRLKRIPLAFRYKDEFQDMPEAYETLLLDVLEGDQTLFVHAEEVEESWRVYTPLVENPPPLHSYPAGTWGPKEAEHLRVPEGDLWR
ncbi:MAG: glucose-6-phosphate dehydrogenase [Myxococcales bacterium]|nr:glucose-6-phosphate dehydrogenase [Myxococcales bacterium]